MQSLIQQKNTVRYQTELLSLEEPVIMGILNYTSDSFYDGGECNSEATIYSKVERMLKQGMDVLDIGCVSSRPNSKTVSKQEELKRVTDVLAAVRKHFPNIRISIDTFRASVAECAAKEFKVGWINDISSGDMDEKMFETVAKHRLSYVAMHMQGNPQTMQHNPQYKDVSLELIDYFSKKLDTLRSMGIADVMIDPGFGFGKSIAHNYQILQELATLKILDAPILIGMSRKSMIYKPLNKTPNEVLVATSALNLQALLNGAKILRVHDVEEAKQCVQLHKLLSQKS